MAKKANNYFVRVAKYQKEHPRATREHAMKMVSKEVAGSKRKTTKRSASHAKPKKRSITKTERITTVGSHRKTSSPLNQSIAISRKIDGLESLLKNTKGVENRNKIKRLINAQHDRLDALTSKLKSA